MEEKKIQKSSQSTLVVMVCTLTTRLFGFIKIGVLNAVFGDKGAADVINGVFNIPNNLRKLFAEGALSAAFIPVLSRTLLEDTSGVRTKKVVRNLITFLLIILIPLNIGFIIFAEPLMKLLLQFPNPEKMVQAVPLFRYLSLYILLVSISAVIMGVLNAHNIFVPSALAPMIFSLCVIFAVIFLKKTMGIFSLAIGVIAGGICQTIFQLPSYLKKGYGFRPDFSFSNPDFRLMIKQYLPVVAASVVSSVNQLIANRFACGLEDGSVTALSNAIVMWQFPFGIFSASIITVFFPRMSRQAVLEDKTGIRETLSHGICFMLITLVPATAGFMFFGREIIALSFERGAFTAQGSIMAGRVLYYYAIGMFSVGAYMFIQRFFYSVKDYITPLLISIGIVIIDVFFSLWLIKTNLRVAGLALANTISFTIGLGVIFLLARKRLARINGRFMLITGLKVTVSMAVMIILLLIYKRVTHPLWTAGSSFVNAGLLGGAVLIGMGSTFLMYLFTNIKIVRDLVFRRFKKQ